MNLVFMQVGDDPTFELFVWSVKLTNPSLNIIQCSDLTTKQINGTHHIHRISADPTNLMTFRLEAFSSLGLNEPAVYVDNDLIFLRSLDNLSEKLNGHRVGLCRRDYKRTVEFSDEHISTYNLSEYRGVTLDEVYPYLACFTYSETASLWSSCLEVLKSIDPKFHKWYGDQEALRIISASGEFPHADLSENEYACVLDCFEDNKELAKAVHFKGGRKVDMVRFAKHIGLIS